MKKFSAYFVLLILFFGSIHQGITQDRSCATDDYQKQLMQDNKFASAFEKQKLEVLEQMASSANQSFADCFTPVRIPIAVHFSGGITNQDMQCLIDLSLAQIDVLNEDFNTTNADHSNYNALSDNCSTDYPTEALSDGICVEFCLATFGHPSSSGIAEGDYAITVGQHAWPSAGSDWAGYMNIFVENNTGQLGIAPLFGANNPNGNGFQVDAIAFGGPGVSCTSGVTINGDSSFNLGRTATHEAGHYFGLFHIFDGCNNGDQIDDTPNQNEPNYGNPLVNTNNCSTSGATDSCNSADFFFNYMDYVNDLSMFMFTSDQEDLMYTVINQDQWLDTTCEIFPPVASFLPNTDQIVCEGSEFTFSDTSFGPASDWAWTISGPDVTIVEDTGGTFTVIFNESGSYTTSLMVSNSDGADTITETIEVTVLPASDSQCVCTDYTVTIELDDYPGETSWEIIDESGNVVVESDSYANQPTGSTVVEQICLIEGCYDFIIYDSFGDGICCGFGNGSYELVEDASGVVVASGGEFSESETTSFCSEINNPDLNLSVSVLPNTGLQGERPMRIIIDLKEVEGYSTYGDSDIIITMTIDSNFTFEWEPNATELAGSNPLENSLWDFDNSLQSQGLLVWRRAKDADGAIIPMDANSISRIGMFGLWNAGASSGTTTFTCTIINGSGAEDQLENNIDFSLINYIPTTD